MALFNVKLKSNFVTSRKKRLLLEGDNVVLKDVSNRHGSYFEAYSPVTRKYLGDILNLEIGDIEVIENEKENKSEE